MRFALAGIAMLMVLGASGAMFGAMLATGEARKAPAALVAIALIVLARGVRGLPAAAAWGVLGVAFAVAWRAGIGILGEDGWIPGDVVKPSDAVADAAWLALLAVLAWKGCAGRLAGPLLAAVVATTRLGAYGGAFVPVMWEDTLGEAMQVGIQVAAGFVAGVLVMLLAGWSVSLLVRIPERRVAPGRLLAVLSVVAAFLRMPLS